MLVDGKITVDTADKLMKSDHPWINDWVSGLAVGDPVKFRGIDVGTVKSMIIDPDNSRLVVVDVTLRKETPVKTDTRASLAMKVSPASFLSSSTAAIERQRRCLQSRPKARFPKFLRR